MGLKSLFIISDNFSFTALLTLPPPPTQSIFFLSPLNNIQDSRGRLIPVRFAQIFRTIAKFLTNINFGIHIHISMSKVNKSN